LRGSQAWWTLPQLRRQFRASPDPADVKAREQSAVAPARIQPCGVCASLIVGDRGPWRATTSREYLEFAL
jgi:hypothetical protein